MNKANLIKQVSEKTNIELKAAKVIVDTFFVTMRESLEKGERIEIRGFGSFSVRHYGAYKGRNPKTGKIVDVRLRNFLTSKLGGK
jgi:integration host factor subunit beta